jgi:hypothetical protein
LSGISSLYNNLSNVVFPIPEAPTKNAHSPVSSFIETSSKAVKPAAS